MVSPNSPGVRGTQDGTPIGRLAAGRTRDHRRGPKGDHPAVHYSERLARAICREVAAGVALHTICQRQDRPHLLTAWGWLRQHPEFREEYTIACEIRATKLAEEVLQIADAASDEPVEKQKMKLNARMWLASKFYPRVFGDRVAHQQLDRDGNPTDPAPVVNVFQLALGKLDFDELMTLRELLAKCGIADEKKAPEIEADASEIDDAADDADD